MDMGPKRPGTPKNILKKNINKTFGLATICGFGVVVLLIYSHRLMLS